MNKTGIFLNYDPFTAESQIYVMRDGKRDYFQVASTVEDIANTIIALAHHHDIYEVFANAPDLAVNEIFRLINEYEFNQYSENKIKVEGI